MALVLAGPVRGADENAGNGEESRDGTTTGSVDFGVGLGLADSDGAGIDLGLDLLVGYEWQRWPKWTFGVQLHALDGWSSSDHLYDEEDILFDSVAVNLTFRPSATRFRWIQLKTGIVHVDYETLAGRDRGIGLSAGFGIVTGSEKVRLHLIDVSRYQAAGEGFTVVSVSFGVFFAMAYE